MKDKEGDKGCDKEEDKRDIEPFQIHFKLDTVTHYMIGLAIFWVTAMSATACSFFFHELLYPPMNGKINCIMHGVLVLFMHLTGLFLFLGKESTQIIHWKCKFYIIFLISFLCVILTPLVSNSLKVFSITLMVHCVICGLSALYIAIIMALTIWKPGPPSFFADSRAVLVEKQFENSKLLKKAKLTGSTTGSTKSSRKLKISTGKTETDSLSGETLNNGVTKSKKSAVFSKTSSGALKI